MTADRALLADYVTKGSEEAFREVVTRYVNLIYSAAFRLADGDAHLAEDIVQTVLVDLARLAGTLSPDVMLGGWLHRRTCHVAASMMRAERRRQHHERKAAEMNAQSDHVEPIYERVAPLLDDAINRLSAKDRMAILLRFFENRDLRSVGAALGCNQDAAQKRVARALEKLRGFLTRRGVTASAAGLATALTAHAVRAAPPGMAVGFSGAALASAATGRGVTFALFKLMATTKLKVAAGVVLAAGIGTTLVIEYQVLGRLRERNHALTARVEQMTLQSRGSQDRSTNKVEPGASEAKRATRRQDLDQLRGQVGALRAQTSQSARLRAENRKLSEATGEPEDATEAAFQKETQHRRQEMQQWTIRFKMYAADQWGQDHSKDRFPGTWEEAAGPIPAGQRDAVLSFANDNFDIVYRGPATNSGTNNLPKPEETILFREKQARRSPTGEWVKIYGFADGHVVSHTEADNNFDDWEKQHIPESK